MQRAGSTGRTESRRWLRRIATLGAGLLACLTIADTALWFRCQHLLDRRLDAFERAATGAGWSLHAQAGRRGGWPFDATLVLRGPHLDGAAGLWPDGIGWSGDAVELSLSPLHPGLLHVAFTGTQTLHAGALRLRVWAAALALRGAGDRFVLDADALHLARDGAGPDDILQVAGAVAELHWRPDRPGGTDLAVTAHSLALPLPFGEVSGRIVQRARLTLALDGGLPAPGLDWPGTLASWRAGGGSLRLEEASLDWGPDRDDAGAALSGRIVPGDGDRLAGDFTLDLTRADRVLATLQRGGAISAGQATAIQAVIGLIAAGERRLGPQPQTHLPLTLRRGVLRLGEIPLLALPSP